MPKTAFLLEKWQVWHCELCYVEAYFFGLNQCRLLLLWNSVYLYKSKMLSSVFLRSFESLQEVKHGEAGAKPTPTVLLMFLSTSIQEHSELSFQFKGVWLRDHAKTRCYGISKMHSATHGVEYKQPILTRKGWKTEPLLRHLKYPRHHFIDKKGTPLFSFACLMHQIKTYLIICMHL